MSHQRTSQVIIAVMLIALFLANCGTPATPIPPAGSTSAPSPLDEALAGKYKGTTVAVGGPWGGRFEVAYENSLRDFEEKTGIDIKFQQIDQNDSSFITAVKSGAGPDIAEFTLGLGALRKLAKDGKVIDLTTVVDSRVLQSRYDQNWLDWATLEGPNGPIVAGVWGPIWTGGVVWYPKAAFDRAGYEVPTTWQELLALSDQIVEDGGTPWCIENGAYGGFMAGLSVSSWIADILLRTAPADYDRWMKGELKSDSPQVKEAVQMMLDIWFKPGYAYGGRQALNQTYYWDVAQPMFYNPPQCWLLKEDSWITEYDGQGSSTEFSNRVFGKDYAFFLLPPIDKSHGIPVRAGAHFTAMFHDRPEVRAFMEYLTTGAQLEDYIKSGINYGFSPHKEAKPEWFSSERERALAQIIVDAQKAGNLSNTDGYWRWLRPEVAVEAFSSYSAYINGNIDLDTMLNQIDTVAAATPVP